MSAIWSASSSTAICTPSRSQARRGDQVFEAAGRGDEDVDAAAQRRDLALDAEAADDGGGAHAASRPRTARVLVVTCWASSRVGTRIKACGRPAAARPSSAVRASTARPNASVLPEPVRPRPSTSRPARPSGSVAAWIGNSSVSPLAVSAVTTAAGRPRSPNVRGRSAASRTVGCGRAGVAARGLATRGLDAAGLEPPRRRLPPVGELVCEVRLLLCARRRGLVRGEVTKSLCWPGFGPLHGTPSGMRRDHKCEPRPRSVAVEELLDGAEQSDRVYTAGDHDDGAAARRTSHPSVSDTSRSGRSRPC